MAEIRIFHYVCFIVCLVCSFYYCTILTQRYLLNESSSQISVKALSESAKHGYPAITICLHADDGNLLLKLDKNIRRKHYNAMMNGRSKIVTAIRKAIMPASYYLRRIRVEYDEESELTGFNKKSLISNYLDPDDYCFTFESTSTTSGALQEVLFLFNTTSLQELKGGNLKVFLHHPRQLIKGSGLLRNSVYNLKNFDSLNDKIETKNMAVVQINQIKLLKNIPSGQTKCNEALENQDAEWMDAVKQLVNCTPQYWKYLWNGDKYPPCNTSDQWKNLSYYHLEPKGGNRKRQNKIIQNNRKLFKTRAPPCTLMDLSVSVTEEYRKFPIHLRNETFYIDVRFSTQTYEQIREVRSYEMTSLFAEMGGYIGIFLGLSVFQGMAEFLGILKWLKNSIKARLE